MPLPRPAPGTTRWWVVGIIGCLAAVGVIAIAIPMPPRMKPGSRFQKSEVVLSWEK